MIPVGEAETAFADDGQLLDADQHAALAGLVAVLAARTRAGQMEALQIVEEAVDSS
jgi:hypothetical protein